MSVQDIITMVSTVGFPIVCCGACFWYINKNGEQHKQEMDKMTDALANNTAAIVELSTLIKRGDENHG